jgi:hypothetical protein
MVTETQAPSTTKTTTTRQEQALAPKIQATRDYALFQLMKGNRPVDYNHVKRLKRSMEADPHLFPSNPIQVNEHMFIIDGQHRRLAAQELGIPVYYIVSPGMSLDETRVLNVTQRRWTLLDFARSYADSGRKDYKIFLQFVNEFPKIAPGILRTYLTDGRKNQAEMDFRRGEFQVEDERHARNNIEKLQAIIAKTHIHVNAPMAGSFLRLFNDPDVFDYDFFMQKLERETARELLRPQSAVRACLRSIEDVYNFQSKTQKRLY